MHFQGEAAHYTFPEELAAKYLSKYFANQKIQYPINPFQMLKDEGILFSLSNFKKLEGVYIPASEENDIPTVGINANRPITRQRFTAAHELCHHFHDANNKEITCPMFGKKTHIEFFADKFAAALLMPIEELKSQVNRRKDTRGEISFDDVLEIAEYFGVSFEACVFRIAYQIHAIPGNVEAYELKRRIKKYRPETIRKAKNMSYFKLYADLVDTFEKQLTFQPTDHARYLFMNSYIYNDSRMEGLEITQEQAAEIVTDLRLNMQNSSYCNDENEVFLSIAGHYDIYQEIFAEPVKEYISVYDTMEINKKLFSHYPYPDFGGTPRQNNTLVIGSKFETTDYNEIFAELTKLDEIVRNFYSRRKEIPMSEYIQHVARVHHKMTVIHPFSDGNGRTSRAFMNVQLVRAGIVPIYIRVNDKKEYIQALEKADITSDYRDLYELTFRLIIRSYVELSQQ